MKLFISLIFLTWILSSHAITDFSECFIERGDLVFFAQRKSADSSQGFKNAIKNSNNSQTIYHVALVIDTASKDLQIIHAEPKNGVVQTSLSTVLVNDKTDIALSFYRVNTTQLTKDNAINRAVLNIGSPYNDIFAENNINSNGDYSLYCSQLIEQIYNQSSSKPLFKLFDLNFNDQNGKLIPYWKKYYEQLGLSVPKNQKGTHPGNLIKNINSLTQINCKTAG